MAFIFSSEAAEPAARVMRLSSNALVREQQLYAVDAGDGYQARSGRRKLHRLAGAVAVRVQEPGVLNRLMTAGGPLAGYTRDTARNGGEVIVLQALAAEREAQTANPARIQERLLAARGVPGVRSAGPVYIDPPSGLYLLPNDELLVRLQPGVDAAAYFGAEWPNARPFLGSSDQFVVRQPGRSAEEILIEVDQHMRNAAVLWAEPNFIAQSVGNAWPDDKYFGRQWHLFHNGQLAGFGVNSTGLSGADINVSNAWNITTGSTNIIVAILDDGVQLNHPDLAPNLATNRNEIPGNGIDDDGNGYIDDVVGGRFETAGFTPNANPFASTNNHGTSVAGLAAARGSNGVGVVGVAYTCRLLPITVVEVPITFERAAEAYYYAGGINAAGVPTWRGADVLNLSFSASESEITSAAISLVSTKGRGGLGCPIFASAGNDSQVWHSLEFGNIVNGQHTFRVEYVKNASGSAGQDAVWLGEVQFPGSRYDRVTGPTLPAGWTTGGPTPWTVDETAGVTGGAVRGAVRNGALGHGQTNWVQILWTNTANVTGRGHVLYRASTEVGDEIRIYDDATLLASLSGQPDENLGIHYPASHPRVISVGATTDYNLRAGYSQYGTNLTISAPGGGGGRNYIFTTDRTGTDGYQTSTLNLAYQNPDYFERFSGTSAAAPVASGVGALMLSVNTNLNPLDLRQILTGTAVKIGSEPYVNGRNDYFGYGKVDASAAVLSAQDYWFLPPDTKSGHILSRVVNLPLANPSIGTNEGNTFLEIRLGGVLSNASGTLGLNGVSGANRVVVSDAGSRWVNTNFLTVGNRGSGNELIVTNGGFIRSASAALGSSTQPSSDNNQVVVAGAGSLWTNEVTLTVGGAGSRNRLLITNGGTVISSNLIVGSQLSSINNRVLVDGGTLRAALDIRRGTNVLNVGLIEASTLRIPVSSGYFEFNGGTLISGGSTVTNGIPFLVGNGTSPAQFNFTGNALHTFNAGITLRPNSTLAGNGAISGILTVQSGAALTPGALMGTLVLSNPPVLQGKLVMEISASGPTVTNDRVQVSGTLMYGGTLVVNNLGPALTVGNRFQLFSAGAYTGGFANINLPPLPPDTTWTNRLAMDGSIEVISTLRPPGLVWTTGDSGPGSLRQAILSLNTSNAPGVITFAVTGVIPLSSDLPALTVPITITGPGAAQLTISGGGAYRLFRLASNSTNRITGLKLADGYTADNNSGAAIFNPGVTILENCQLSSNTVVGGFGGAVANLGSGTLRITNCSFLGNVVRGGNGQSVYSGGGGGGGAGMGGAIFTEGTALTLVSCTLAGNIAAGGNGGSGLGFQLNFPPGGNGGFPNRGSGGPTGAGGGPGGFGGGGGGGGASGGTGGTGGFGGGGGGGGTALGQGGAPGAYGGGGGNGGLGASANAGGGGGAGLGGGVFARTGSVLIANCTFTENLATNGLGGSGYQGGGLGQGVGGAIFLLDASLDLVNPAFAGNIASTGYPVVGGSTTVANTNDSGVGSLRQAVLIANYSFVPSAISFAPSLSGQTIGLASGQLTLGTSMTLNASPLPAGVTVAVRGGVPVRAFEVLTGATVGMSKLTIRDGAADFGGGIRCSGSLALTNCTITANSATTSGGAVWAAGLGNITAIACTFSSNSSPRGAINIAAATVTLSQCTFRANTATSIGGGALNTSAAGAVVTLDSCTISGNQAIGPALGGGLRVISGSTVTIINCILAGNTCPTAGSENFNGNLLISGPNLTSGNPLLAPLGEYGGPTQTMPPLPGSPAIDGCINGTSFATDQCGKPRILGAFADIGAVEGVFDPAFPLVNVRKLGNGSVQFGFTNLSGPSYTVLASTNVGALLNTWVNLGPAVEAPPGTFQFTDLQATNYPLRFYRVQGP